MCKILCVPVCVCGSHAYDSVCAHMYMCVQLCATVCYTGVRLCLGVCVEEARRGAGTDWPPSVRTHMQATSSLSMPPVNSAWRQQRETSPINSPLNNALLLQAVATSYVTSAGPALLLAHE